MPETRGQWTVAVGKEERTVVSKLILAVVVALPIVIRLSEVVQAQARYCRDC